jgi:hypothetical protein
MLIERHRFNEPDLVSKFDVLPAIYAEMSLKLFGFKKIIINRNSLKTLVLLTKL